MGTAGLRHGARNLGNLLPSLGSKAPGERGVPAGAVPVQRARRAAAPLAKHGERGGEAGTAVRHLLFMSVIIPSLILPGTLLRN